MKKDELEKIYEHFVGIGKVQSLELKQLGDDNWEWTYREGKKTSSIIDPNRDFLEKMHLEFGGRNPETCRANDKFLELNSWNSEDLITLGHRVTKARVKGQRILRNDPYPFGLPSGTGSNEPVKAKRDVTKDEVIMYLKEVEVAGLTRAFSTPEEFDSFREFLLYHPQLKRLHWYIELLGTETKLTKDQCVWKRERVGDGTRRMALELYALNSKHYTECRRADLHAAADDMFESPCQRVTVKKPKEFSRTICFYAAENGEVDIDGYTAVELEE